jgi:hypothetical protein
MLTWYLGGRIKGQTQLQIQGWKQRRVCAKGISAANPPSIIPDRLWQAAGPSRQREMGSGKTPTAKTASSIRYIPRSCLLAILQRTRESPICTSPTQEPGGGVKASPCTRYAGHRFTAIHTARRYHILQLSGRNILKLAERCPEWRRAVKELAQKQNLQPKTPMLRRLLELAENPPARLLARAPRNTNQVP